MHGSERRISSISRTIASIPRTIHALKSLSKALIIIHLSEVDIDLSPPILEDRSVNICVLAGGDLGGSSPREDRGPQAADPIRSCRRPLHHAGIDACCEPAASAYRPMCLYLCIARDLPFPACRPATDGSLTTSLLCVQYQFAAVVTQPLNPRWDEKYQDARHSAESSGTRECSA